MELQPGFPILAYVLIPNTNQTTAIYGEYVGIAESGMCKVFWNDTGKYEERTTVDVMMMRKNYLKER